MKVIVGCDGGGTKTIAKALVLSPHGRVVAQGQGIQGAGNIRNDCDLACRNITTAVQAAILAANCQAGQPVDVLVCGLAGAGSKTARQAAAATILAKLEVDQLEVTTDIELVLAAAELETSCLALVAGTGSIAWARDARGRSFRSGGLGAECGDRGSGHWIGEQLRLAVPSLGDDSPLLRRLLGQFGEQQREQLSQQLMVADRTIIGSLARHAFATSAEETIAAEVLERAAEHLACLVKEVTRQAGLDKVEVPWAVAGGVLIAQPQFANRIALRCAEKGLYLQPARVVESPVDGALKLARQLVIQ